MTAISLSSKKAHEWLNLLSGSDKDKLSLFANEYKELIKLAPIKPVQVFRNPDDEIKLVLIDRVGAIKIIKKLYQFSTTKELGEELKNDLVS